MSLQVEHSYLSNSILPLLKKVDLVVESIEPLSLLNKTSLYYTIAPDAPWYFHPLGVLLPSIEFKQKKMQQSILFRKAI